MKKVQNLVEEANGLFEQAEVAVESSLENGHDLFLRGITLLFRGFLAANGIDSNGTISESFAECKQLEEEFEDIEEELDALINADLSFNDAEDISDSANEIWDFVIDLVTDDECH
ncbi:MAG TPA: hypothetical protein VEC37_06490 [Bacillota bacterium]|nr:hypothetical protein [Bacillota bacterium]